MSDIPEDVMKAALATYEALPLVYDGWDEDAVVLDIAKAILAERERCANLVEKHKDAQIAPFDDWTANVGKRIATAIRGA